MRAYNHTLAYGDAIGSSVNALLMYIWCVMVIMLTNEMSAIVNIWSGLWFPTYAVVHGLPDVPQHGGDIDG